MVTTSPMSTCATLAQAPVSPLAPASPRHDTKTTSPGLRPSSAQTRRRELLPSFVNTGDIDRDTDNPPHLAAVLGSLHGLAIHGPGEVGRARARPVAGEAARSAYRGHGSSAVWSLVTWPPGHSAPWPPSWARWRRRAGRGTARGRGWTSPRPSRRPHTPATPAPGPR